MLKFVCCVVLVAIFNVQSLEAASLENKELVSALIGMWCIPNKETGICQSHEEYLEDGILSACANFKEGTVGDFMRVKATYSVKGRSVCFEVVASNNSYLPIGHTFCATAKEIDQEKYVYAMERSGNSYVAHRLPGNAKECPSEK